MSLIVESNSQSNPESDAKVHVTAIKAFRCCTPRYLLLPSPKQDMSIIQDLSTIKVALIVSACFFAYGVSILCRKMESGTMQDFNQWVTALLGRLGV
jgi:hypothetical protein